MNDQTAPLPTIPADVRLFLAVVRRELADLDPEELSEITDGLEADLVDLVAERGPAALGDPKAYARELRSAAGITETSRTKKPGGSFRESVTGFLDARHAWFDRQVTRIPGDVQPTLEWLRPAWWILRASIAAQILCMFLGTHPFGVAGIILFAVAALGSVQLGRGRFWPGGDRGLGARLVLLGLNAFAIVITVPVLSQLGDNYGSDWDTAWNDGYQAARGEIEGDNGYPDGDAAGTWLSLKGKPVHNIYAYDSQGRRIAGVQLFDQDGRPLEVAAQAICPKADSSEVGKEQRDGGEWVCYDHMAMKEVPGYVLYPWTNGQAQLKNVFPLAGRVQEALDPTATAFSEKDAPTLGEWPFAEVPRVSLPGITSGTLDEPSDEGDEKAGKPADEAAEPKVE